MTPLRQIRSRLITGSDIVNRDAGYTRPLDVQCDNRNPSGNQIKNILNFSACGDQYQPVDIFSAQKLNIIPLLLRVIHRVTNHQRVASLLELRFDIADQASMEGADHTGDNHTD